MKTVFALVDANNFFVSCERIFRPELANRPVIVRSSNDGCVVARSNEVKALGIPMGIPVFKIRHLIEQYGITEFSGNFELYGDISHRLSEILARVCPNLEIYSVDESFLDLSQLGLKSYTKWSQSLRKNILDSTSIPISIGIAQTKTLAKIANHLAKREPIYHGVLDLMNKSHLEIDQLLLNFPLKEVWGVGWRLSPKLQAEGITNAWQLKQLSPKRAGQLMGLHGRRLVAELNGVACHQLEPLERVRQSLSTTRMFGHDTKELHVLESAVANLTAVASARLRKHHLLASRGSLFLTTNKHKPGYRRWVKEVKLNYPSADTGQLTSHFIQALTNIFSPSCSYHRAGVLLYDLSPANRLQIDLLGRVDLKRHEASQVRMMALDRINTLYGPSAIHYAAEDLSRVWRPRQGLRSPRYTTSWTELPEAKISYGL